MRKHNLIFIVVDSLRKDFMLQYGEHGFKKFMDEGIFLNKLIVCAPETYVSVGTFLTGLYPPKHNLGTKRLDETNNIKHIYDYLNKDNYKFLIHGMYNPFGPSYALDYYVNNCGRLSEEVCLSTMNLNPDISETLKFIESCADNPFFVYNHFFTLRSLETNMNDSIDNCCKNGNIEKVVTSYAQCIQQVDKQIERLFEFIKDKLSNTLVIITADHGESFKLYDNHVLGDTGLAWVLHNGSRYDESINVPMILTGLNLSKNKLINEQIRQIDIFPTILKLLDYQLISEIDGEALDFDNIVSKDVIIYPTFETKKQAIRTKDNFKLIFDSKNIELYNLSNDCTEQDNIISERSAKVREIFELMEQFPTHPILTSKELIFRYTDYKNLDYVHNLFKQLGVSDEWSQIAEKYNNISWVTDENYLNVIREMLELKLDDVVLEVGCGTAIVLDHLKNKVKQVYGIDSNPDMLKLVSKNIDVRIGTADNIPFQSETFDKVVLRMVLHCIKECDLKKIMIEIKRVLKIGGILLVAERVPIRDDFIASFRSLVQEREDRLFFTSWDLISIVYGCFSNIKEVDEIVLKQQSLLNWLNNSAVDFIRHEKIYRKYNDDSELEYKKAANFTKIQDDILFDMRHFLITSKKY
jgi:ubiquinone/menaquinone biosynthesis C-methylase UbiE